MRSLWLAASALFFGCGGPQFVESSAEIDAFLARGNYAYACVAYRSDDEGIRTYAAKRLAAFPGEADATKCTCEALYNAEKGTWDEAVALGLEGSRRDDLAACLKPAAVDARVKKRAVLVQHLGKFMAPAAWDALADIGKTEKDTAVRAAAVRALQPSHGHTDVLLDFLKNAEAPEVRAAAAAALDDHKGDAVHEALLAALQGDGDEAVRLAAVEVASQKHDKATDAVLCKVMMDDAAAPVRAATIESFRGTKSKRAIDCLRTRLKTKEDDATVRQATLDVIASSPRDDASRTLCEHIGPHVRMYLRDKMLSKVGGADIVEAQNHNDWENSYDCVAKARAQGGYSCYGRNYLAHWFNELGGSATPPHCPGMSKN